jgi:hypothetical protein
MTFDVVQLTKDILTLESFVLSLSYRKWVVRFIVL